MLKRKYKQSGFNVLELHYLRGLESSTISSQSHSNIDIIKINQANENISGNLQKACTLHIDLTQSNDVIFKSFRPTTRNEIRRNLNKDKVEYTYEENLDDKRIKSFVNNLTKFTKAKNFHKDCRTDEDYMLRQINDFKEHSLLTAVTINDIVLSEHLYFYDDNKARYMYGISHRLNNIDIPRNTVGRSNRGLHWFDIQEFKKRGIKTYDLGGVTCNSADNGLQNVRKFKEGFSQNMVDEYNGNIAVSLRGRFALLVKSIIPGN